MTPSSLSTDLLRHAQQLSTAYLGLAHGLFAVIATGKHRPETLADAVSCDHGYVSRWLDAAIAQGLVMLDEDGVLTTSGPTDGLQISRSSSDAARLLQAVYTVLITDAMIPDFRSGHRPGYSIVNHFRNLVPHYGAIAESLYGPVFDSEVFPLLSFLAEPNIQPVSVLDFGCGDCWLLRRMAHSYPSWKFHGVASSRPNDALEATNINYLTDADFCHDTTSFDLIVAHKVLHHLGDALLSTLNIFLDKLKPDGIILIWEFAWPLNPKNSCPNDDRAFLNLIEYVQNSQFLSSKEIEKSLASIGMEATRTEICGGREVIYLSRRTPLAEPDAGDS